MKWIIPAKTFLLGEYAAVAEASAMLLTTTPFFELSLIEEEGLYNIHPESPAGQWWIQQKHQNKGLVWEDPYQSRGGLGASSAQFLACYLASCSLKSILPKFKAMLHAYYQSSWSGKGLRPSGYDVIAQANQGCVFINRQKNTVRSYPWPFKDLSFLLIHTGVKLATHHHLQNSALPSPINKLSAIVDEAHQAFEKADSGQLIKAVNDYHQQLASLKLVARHSLELINTLKTYSEIQAIKGCGALGADILLVLVAKNELQPLKTKLILNNWSVLASEDNLTSLDDNFFA